MSCRPLLLVLPEAEAVISGNARCPAFYACFFGLSIRRKDAKQRQRVDTASAPATRCMIFL